MNFNLNKLTVKAQEVVQSAVDIAQNYNNQIVEPEHIFAAMLQESGSVAESMVQKTGANVGQLKVKIGGLLENLPKITGAGIGNQQLSTATGKMFDTAAEEAKNLNDEYVSTEHLLLALTYNNGNVGNLLKSNNITKEIVLAASSSFPENSTIIFFAKHT